ncbi:MAG: efflux RND transporter periplasmic adaptor subunit [Campylobacterota bacterium]|nr:efflux RND transporter periplasmic adaptor subunit [Campylobacterota bacterium]
MRLLLLLVPLVLFAKEASVTQLFSVETVKAKEIKSAKTKKNYGYVTVDQARVYSIAPRFGGYVIELNADKIYKYVKKGEPLATIYSPEVYKAKEDYLNSYNYSKGKANKRMLRSAKLKLELLGVSTKEINALVKNKKVSKSTTIYSPENAYIFKKNINKGSAFSAKKTIFEIVNLDEVWVEAKIFEEDLEWIERAKEFEVRFKTNDTIHHATSTLLYPKLDPKEATLTLRLHLANADTKLFPGMYASVTSKAKTQSHLTLPRSSVIRKNGKHYVFMVGEFKGEYEPREVFVQTLNNESYVVISGLNAGDEVVDNALFMMDSDAQINSLY